MKKHAPWTIKESRSVYRGKMMEVFEDEVIQPDGKDGTYPIVRMKDGAGILALDDEGQVYLVKEFRYALGREDVETVRGAIDEGEEPIDAARRELREEPGIEAVLETVKMPFTEAVEKALRGEFTDSTTCVLISRARHYLQKNS
jgi:ADP-ribose pyrophosphatase